MYIYGPDFSKYIVQMLIRSHSLVRNDWKSLISNIIKNYCGQAGGDIIKLGRLQNVHQMFIKDQ